MTISSSLFHIRSRKTQQNEECYVGQQLLEVIPSLSLRKESNLNRTNLQGVKFYSLYWKRITINIHGLSEGLETWLLQKEAQTPLLANEFYAHLNSAHMDKHIIPFWLDWIPLLHGSLPAQTGFKVFLDLL